MQTYQTAFMRLHRAQAPFKRMKMLCVGTFLCMFCTLPVFASDMFERLDKNADGKIDEIEYAAATAIIFEELDTDSNGIITELEVAKFPLEFQNEKFADILRRKKGVNLDGFKKIRSEQFLLCDIDNDKHLSHHEIQMYHKYMFYKALDSNSDGCISPEEFKAFPIMQWEHK